MLLTATEYASIRGLLDITLDEDSLPDETIELPPYGPAAERWLLERDPIAGTRTGLQQSAILSALCCYAAALIAPAIPNLTAETQGPYIYSRQAVNWNERAAQLKARAEQELASVLTPGASVVRFPTMFTVAAGGRGE